jgi:hypothetical protein
MREMANSRGEPEVLRAALRFPGHGHELDGDDLLAADRWDEAADPSLNVVA